MIFYVHCGLNQICSFSENLFLINLKRYSMIKICMTTSSTCDQGLDGFLILLRNKLCHFVLNCMMQEAVCKYINIQFSLITGKNKHFFKYVLNYQDKIITTGNTVWIIMTNLSFIWASNLDKGPGWLNELGSWITEQLILNSSLSPIRRGFAPSFVNYKKGCTRFRSRKW
jgi:hypothetical protein